MDTDVRTKKRWSTVWICSNGKGAGHRWAQGPKQGCGKFNAIWSTFDPHEGGNRKKRWLGHCSCGKTTAINPASGNIARSFDSRQEGIEYAKMRNERSEDVSTAMERAAAIPYTPNPYTQAEIDEMTRPQEWEETPQYEGWD